LASTRDPESRLRLFVAKVDEAISRRAIQEATIRSTFALTGSAYQSTLEVDTGDQEDVRSLLIDFRSFVSPKEPEFANWVFNELERRLTSDEVRMEARMCRRYWDLAKELRTRGMVNDESFTAEQTFDLVVNGAIFHRDEAKREMWNLIPVVIQQEMLSILNGFVLEGLRTLAPTRHIVDRALTNGLLDLS
jgi:hypothetical protein